MTNHYNHKPTRVRRLYKDSRTGKISGVFSGFGDYLGINPAILRVIGIVAILFSGPVVVIAYLLTALILNDKPHGFYDQ